MKYKSGEGSRMPVPGSVCGGVARVVDEPGHCGYQVMCSAGSHLLLLAARLGRPENPSGEDPTTALG